MVLLSNIILFGFIFILNACKAIELQPVADYFANKEIKSIVFLGCSYKDNIYSLKFFIKRNFTILTDFSGIKPFERTSIYVKLGIFVDSTCTPNQKIIKSATRFTTMSTTFDWLVYSSKSSDAPALFDSTDMGLFSDVTLITAECRLFQVLKSESDDDASLVELGHNGRGLKLVTLEKSKGRHLAKSTVTGGIVFSQDVYNRNNLSNELQDIVFKPGEDSANRNTYALVLLISNLFNFSLEIRVSSAFGWKNADGKWSGVMGQLQNKEINMTMTTLPSAQRLEISYISLPLQEYAMTYVFRQPKILGTYRATLLEFTLPTWIVVGMSIFWGGLTFALTQRLNRTNETLIGGLLLSLGTFTNQGLTLIPKNCSSRTTTLSLLLTGTLVSMYYNAATMTSLLTPSSPSIRNLNNLLHSGLKLGYLNATYVNNIPARKRVFPPVVTRLMDQRVFVYSLEEGIGTVRKEQAFCAEQFVVYKAVADCFRDSEICDLSYINADTPTFAVSFLQKDSHFREMYQRGLLRLQEHGLKQREHSRWIGKRPACLGSSEFTVVGSEAISVALSVFFLGIVMSLMALSIERCLSSRTRVMKRRQNAVMTV